MQYELKKKEKSHICSQIKMTRKIQLHTLTATLMNQPGAQTWPSPILPITTFTAFILPIQNSATPPSSQSPSLTPDAGHEIPSQSLPWIFYKRTFQQHGNQIIRQGENKPADGSFFGRGSRTDPSTASARLRRVAVRATCSHISGSVGNSFVSGGKPRDRMHSRESYAWRRNYLKSEKRGQEEITALAARRGCVTETLGVRASTWWGVLSFSENVTFVTPKRETIIHIQMLQFDRFQQAK